MKIRAMRCAVVHRAYDGSTRNTRHAWNGKNYVLVQLEADNGCRGLGEMYCDGDAVLQPVQTAARMASAPKVAVVLREKPGITRRRKEFTGT